MTTFLTNWVISGWYPPCGNAQKRRLRQGSLKWLLLCHLEVHTLSVLLPLPGGRHAFFEENPIPRPCARHLVSGRGGIRRYALLKNLECQWRVSEGMTLAISPSRINIAGLVCCECSGGQEGGRGLVVSPPPQGRPGLETCGETTTTISVAPTDTRMIEFALCSCVNDGRVSWKLDAAEHRFR